MYNTYNANLPNETKIEIARKVFTSVIIEPFIEFLDKFIEYGANPKFKIGKLKRYREIDELKAKG